MSADTLGRVVDFCYSGSLPEGIDMAALAPLFRAAHRMLMPLLLDACWVRLAGTVASGDEGLFLVHDAAAEIGHAKTTALVRGEGRGASAATLMFESLDRRDSFAPLLVRAAMRCGCMRHA